MKKWIKIVIITSILLTIGLFFNYKKDKDITLGDKITNIYSLSNPKEICEAVMKNAIIKL